jgi:hypothetical protein
MEREKLLQVKMSTKELKELKVLADSKGLSMSAMARLLIKEAVERGKERHPNHR